MGIESSNPLVVPASSAITFDKWAIMRFHSEGTGIKGPTSVNYRMRLWGVDSAGHPVEQDDPAYDKEFSVQNLQSVIAGTPAVAAVAGTDHSPAVAAVAAVPGEPVMGVAMQLLVAVIGWHASQQTNSGISLPAGYLKDQMDTVVAELQAISAGM